MKASEKAFSRLVENGSRETNIKKKMLSQRRVRSARWMAWYMI
jgi:hypothetical protein